MLYWQRKSGLMVFTNKVGTDYFYYSVIFICWNKFKRDLKIFHVYLDVYTKFWLIVFTFISGCLGWFNNRNWNKQILLVSLKFIFFSIESSEISTNTEVSTWKWDYRKSWRRKQGQSSICLSKINISAHWILVYMFFFLL